MGGTVFAGSSIRSRESRILILVSLLQLPESKILNQEHVSVAGPFPRPTSPSVSFWQPQFSLLPTFLPLSLFLKVNRASLVSQLFTLFPNFPPHFLTWNVSKWQKPQILSLFRPALHCSLAQIKPRTCTSP